MDKDLEITYKELKDFIKRIGVFLKDEDIIPFSFLVNGLYPDACSNFQNRLGDSYHKGFMEGYLEGKKIQNET